MAARLERPDTAFTLSPSERKRPRQKSDAHLKAIRMLPCVVCLKRPVEAAHIRRSSLIHGKRSVGTAEKPDDRWTLPLCPEHHLEQHSMKETAFYDKYLIDPFFTALSLWGSKDDSVAMDIIIRGARKP